MGAHAKKVVVGSLRSPCRAHGRTPIAHVEGRHTDNHSTGSIATPGRDTHTDAMTSTGGVDSMAAHFGRRLRRGAATTAVAAAAVAALSASQAPGMTGEDHGR